MFVYNFYSNNSGKTGADSKKKGSKASTSAAAKSSTTFKEDEGEVDAMEEEMGAAAAADADQERVSFACVSMFVAEFIVRLLYFIKPMCEIHNLFTFFCFSFEFLTFLYFSSSLSFYCRSVAEPGDRAGARAAQSAGQVSASVVLYGGQRTEEVQSSLAERDLHLGPLQVSKCC